VAGDVADAIPLVTDVLGGLRERFAEVFFVPGNHELWVRNDPRDSVEKFHAVLAACAGLGVRTEPARAAPGWCRSSPGTTPPSTCAARRTTRRSRRGPTSTSAAGPAARLPPSAS